MPEFFPGERDQFVVGQIGQLRLAGAADKSPHQDFSIRSAARILDAGKTARQDLAVLDQGDHETESVHAMGDLISTIAERDNRAACVGNLGQQLGGGGFDLGQQPAGRQRLDRHDHPVHVDGFRPFAAHADRPATFGTRRERSDRTADADAVLRQTSRDRGDQTVHAVARRNEHAVAGTAAAFGLLLPLAARLGPDGADQAAVGTLHFDEPRHGCLDAQPLGIARVDPAHQRLDQPIVGLAPEPADHKRCQTLVFVLGIGRNKKLPGHPQLADRTENRRGDHGPDAAGGHDDKALRDFAQPTSADHERLPVRRVGGNQLVLETDPPTQVKTPRKLGDKIVRTPLQQKSVATFGLQRSSQSGGCLEEFQVDGRIEFVDAMGGRQTGNSATDHRDSLFFVIEIAHALLLWFGVVD